MFAVGVAAGFAVVAPDKAAAVSCFDAGGPRAFPADVAAEAPLANESAGMGSSFCGSLSARPGALNQSLTPPHIGGYILSSGNTAVRFGVDGGSNTV